MFEDQKMRVSLTKKKASFSAIDSEGPCGLKVLQKTPDWNKKEKYYIFILKCCKNKYLVNKKN